MSGDVFHIPALGEQITNIAKISIIGNLRNSLLLYPHCFRNFLLRPSKAGQPEDNGVSTRFLPDTDIRDPGIDCLLYDPEFFCQGRFRPPTFRVC